MPSTHFLVHLPGAERVCKHSLLQRTDNRGNSRCERKLIRSLTQLGRVQGYSSQRQLTILTGLSKHSNHCTCLFSVFLSHFYSSRDAIQWIHIKSSLFLASWLFLTHFGPSFWLLEKVRLAYPKSSNLTKLLSSSFLKCQFHISFNITSFIY